MKWLALYFYLGLTFAFAQSRVTLKLIEVSELDVTNLIGIDKFGTLYYFNTDTFYALGSKGNLEYTNLQLSNITTVDTFNPLKLCVFYDDFNTVILLDNRLTEIKKIDFNTLSPFRDVSFVTVANANELWLYNVNSQQLELFDYATNQTKIKTLPLEGEVLDLTSNYNYCWVLTSDFIYTYSYVGTLLSKEKNNGFDAIKTDGNTIYLKKENTILYKLGNSKSYTSFNSFELLIKQFFVTDETLYIYDGKNLYNYQLINN